MRIGIYLGRHSTNSSGMAVYARALVRGVLEHLDQEGRDEVVFYGDASFFSEEFELQLLESPVALTFRRTSFDLPASFSLRPLKNGVRCKAVVRVLPSFLERRISSVVDQFLLPILARLDGVELLHGAANTAFPLSSLPQIVTVHDLYQGWPATGAPRSLLKRAFQRYYQALFSLQFRKVRHVITVAQAGADEVHRRFSFDRTRLSAIPLGVDRDFLRHERRGFSSELAEWLREMKLPAGYVLIMASLDPRKNLDRAVRAWKALDPHQRKRGVVFHLLDKKAINRCRELLGEEFAAEHVYFTRNLERKKVPFLFGGAAVVLLPSLAEGFGLPALEALAVGTKVVTTPVDSLQGLSSERLFFCIGEEEESIHQALKEAVSNGETFHKPGASQKRRSQPEVGQSRMSQRERSSLKIEEQEGAQERDRRRQLLRDSSPRDKNPRDQKQSSERQSERGDLREREASRSIENLSERARAERGRRSRTRGALARTGTSGEVHIRTLHQAIHETYQTYQGVNLRKMQKHTHESQAERKREGVMQQRREIQKRNL